MGRRSKHADSLLIEEDNAIHYAEHKLFSEANARAFTPTASESDRPGTHGNLFKNSIGDWSWQSHRDKRIAGNFKTFKGVPPSAAELYGPRIRN